MARRSAAEVLRDIADDVDRRGALMVFLDRGVGNVLTRAMAAWLWFVILTTVLAVLLIPIVLVGWLF